MFENFQSFNQTSSIVSILNTNSITIKKKQDQLNCIKKDKKLFLSRNYKNFINGYLRGGNKNQAMKLVEKELNNNITKKSNEEDQTKQKNLALIPYKQSNVIISDKIFRINNDILNKNKYKIKISNEHTMPIDYLDITNYPLPLRKGCFFNTEYKNLNIFLRHNYTIVQWPEWPEEISQVVHSNYLEKSNFKYNSVPSFLGINKFLVNSPYKVLSPKYNSKSLKNYHFSYFPLSYFPLIVRFDRITHNSLFDQFGRDWHEYYLPLDNFNHRFGQVLFPAYDKLICRCNMKKRKLKIPTDYGYNEYIDEFLYLFRDPTKEFYRYLTDHYYYRYNYMPSGVFFEIKRHASFLVKDEYKKRNIFVKIWGYIKTLIRMFIKFLMSFFRRDRIAGTQWTNVIIDACIRELEFPITRYKMRLTKHKGFGTIDELRRHYYVGIWFSVKHNEKASTFIPIIYLLDSDVIDDERMIGLKREYRFSSDDLIKNDFIYYTKYNQKNIRYYFRRYINPKMDNNNFPLFGLHRRYIKNNEYGLPLHDFYKEGKLGFPSYTYDEKGNYIFKHCREMTTLYNRNFVRKLRQDHYNIFYGYPQINKYGTIIHNYPYPQTDNLGGLMYPCPYFDKDGIIVSEKKYYNWGLFYPYFYPEPEKSDLINPQQYWTNQHIWIKKYLGK